MTTPLAFRTVAAVVALAFVLGCLAAVAQAQAPATPSTPTLVATGNGRAKVTPKDRNDNASIAAAVESAESKALPRAVIDGKREAQALAAAAGVTLGALTTISDNAASGFYYGPFGTVGTFGPGKWCGTVRSAHLVTRKDGTRKRVLGKPHRVCRFPSTITRTVTLTYALG